MKTILKNDITIKQVCEGFVYNELEGKGLFGLSGKLTIQPEYQRNYIYADGKRDVAVIDSILKFRTCTACSRPWEPVEVDFFSGMNFARSL